MDRLCALFEQLKLRKVESFIASGNVIFESAASAASLESKIEKHLEAELGFTVTTMVRSTANVCDVAGYDAFPKLAPPAGKGGMYVGFLKSEPAPEGIAKVMALGGKLNEFHFLGREVYWYARDRMQVLKLTGATFERALRVPATFRNVTTVRKLAEKYGAR